MFPGATPLLPVAETHQLGTKHLVGLSMGLPLNGLNHLAQHLSSTPVAVQNSLNMLQQPQQFQTLSAEVPHMPAPFVSIPVGSQIALPVTKKIKLEQPSLPFLGYPALGQYTDSILSNEASILAQAKLHHLSRISSDDQKLGKKRKICQFAGGCNRFSRGSSGLCIRHGGERADSRSLCAHPGGCNKGAQGPTNLCKIHGGGQRCKFPECTKSSQGPSKFCIRHGGGRRCLIPGCTKSAQGKTQKCKAHGGGKDAMCKTVLNLLKAQQTFAKLMEVANDAFILAAQKQHEGKQTIVLLTAGGKDARPLAAQRVPFAQSISIVQPMEAEIDVDM
eukprot:CAMPEP_0184017804 /NCGR_PEP_ID=MMETSP0954-20121128/7760_1 /TAXON_ID=627963 /ORGANISM="Aplanochytrium sp, Strain PBS07" /LENGTH=332 /DNA_ID=CAMNT_0026299121 /DNA_START=243 /DNA_END=1242 /DNA_ORIENTATION=+